MVNSLSLHAGHILTTCLYISRVFGPVITHCNVVSISTLQIPVSSESFTPRWYHAGGLIHTTASRRLLVVNGGIADNPTKYKSPHDYPLISQTTVIEFGEFCLLAGSLWFKRISYTDKRFVQLPESGYVIVKSPLAGVYVI